MSEDAKTFEELDFGPRRGGIGGVQALTEYPNGYGASVIKGFGTYGYEKGLYEIAVIEKDGGICYTTPITSDVIGHLTEDGVTETLQKIADLPPAVEGIVNAV